MDIITLGAAMNYARKVSGAVDVDAAIAAAAAAEEAQGKAEDAQEAAEAAVPELRQNDDGTYTLVRGGGDDA